MVALLVFALGAGVSVYEGVLHLIEPEHSVSPLVAYAVLAIAFALEAGSTLAAFRQFNGNRGALGW